MGQNMTISKYRPPKGEEISRSQFEFQYVIGKGGFGKVWKVIDKKTKTSYALKEMQKVKVIDKKSENSIKYERELLSRLKHPFIVNMYYSFQDFENLYLVMDLLTGGDLRYQLSRTRRFSEEQTKFFIACMILGLEYIHSKNVIHRDIKPENLVLDDKGYVRITDFGIAKVFSNRNSSETSGTPGYMAPEVMNRQNHTMAVDYFAVGVIGYEFMMGKRPYLGKSRKEIKDQMTARQAYIKLGDIPDGWSEEAADFFNKLLIRKPENRLGYRGAHEVKEHPWIKYYPWKQLYEKTIESPFIPERRDNFDKRYCEAADKISLETKIRYEQYRNEHSFTNLFQNFTYYGIIEENFREVTTNDDNINKKTLPSNKPSSKSTIQNKKSANSNTVNTTNSNNTTTAKTTNRLHRTTSSILNVKKKPPKLVSSYSSINLFSFNHNKPNSDTTKSYLQKTINRSYVNNALLSKSIHSELNRTSKSVSRSPNRYQAKSPISRKPINISYIKPTSPYRSPSPLNKISNRSISPSKISLLSSYAEKNKKKFWDNTITANKSPVRNNNSSITSNLLKQIRLNSAMMKSKKNANICLRRSNSNYGNLMSKNIIETPISMKSNDMKTTKRRNSGQEENNVNVNVVVINNGIINLNDSNSNICSSNNNSKRQEIRKSNVNGKGFWCHNKKLTQSNSIKYLFQNYQISPMSNNRFNQKK